MAQRTTPGPPPRPPGAALLPPEHKPVLLVLVNAEEEFDWDAGFDRAATGVSAMRCVDRAQQIFDRHGIRPTYVVDYPVANQPEGSAPLREIAASGRACIGAHLHPWVTPPHDEPLGAANSFPGNLPRALEAAKLRSTLDAIERGVGVRPRVYQAGRYGIGPNTPSLLADLGITVDLSISPPYDYSAEGGPDFSAFDCQPFWMGPVLAVPLTGGYVGFASGGGHALHTLANGPLRWSRLSGVLARIGALDRLRLSPEGFDHGHHRRLTHALLARGVRTFVFSFHAPSLKPGCTQYVQSDADLADFLDRCRRYFDFFLGELGGISMTPPELRERIVAADVRAPS